MLTLLHDPNNAASTAFLALYGTSGAVITGHDACVAAFPNIQGFPTVVYQDAAGNNHALYNPGTMEAVTAWQAGIDNPPAPPTPTVISKYAFASRFTPAERQSVLAATASDVILQDARSMLDMAQDVDLTDPNTANYVNYLASKSLLTASRATAILTP